MDPIFGTEALTIPVFTFRLAMSFVAGLVLGWERASRHQSAGIRTHILISVGSTLLMLLSIWIPEQFQGAKNGDPGRIAAQVVSGIGFLGAGSILRLGNNIRGLTTAASIWVVAALGLAIGAGMYLPAAVGLAFCLGALMLMDPIERRFFPAERTKHLCVRYNGQLDYEDRIRDLLNLMRIRVQSVDVHTSVKENETELKFLIRIPVEAHLQDLYKAIKKIGKIDSVELKEKF